MIEKNFNQNDSQNYNEAWKTGQEAFRISYSKETGLVLTAYVPNATQEEIQAFKSGESFKLSFVSLNDIGFFAFRIGQEITGDAPFCPNICKEPVYYQINEYKENKKVGIPLIVEIIDTIEGRRKGLRLIGLNNRFSITFAKWLEEVQQKSITEEQYNSVVNHVYQKYQFKDLEKLALVKHANY